MYCPPPKPWTRRLATPSNPYTTVQADSTNLLDAPELQVYGAPNYGRLVCVGLLFDIK